MSNGEGSMTVRVEIQYTPHITPLHRARSVTPRYLPQLGIFTCDGTSLDPSMASGVSLNIYILQLYSVITLDHVAGSKPARYRYNQHTLAEGENLRHIPTHSCLPPLKDNCGLTLR